MDNNEGLQRQLRQEEPWMRATTFCLPIATAIMAVAFHNGLYAPGGFNFETGRPNFDEKTAYLVYWLSNAIAFFSSIAAVSVLLSMMFSRSGRRFRVILCLIMLLISVPNMLVSLGCAVFLNKSSGLNWIPSFVSMLPSLPTLLLMVSMFVIGKKLSCEISFTPTVEGNIRLVRE